MLTIRFSRIGKKKNPIYRLIISEKTKDPYGRSLEILGTYNPFSKELLNLKTDRVKYWLSVGAGMSASVNNLLIEKGIIKGDKVKASTAKPSKKAPKEEAKPAAETAPKTEETPKEETPAETTENKETKE